ncbi:hypothetical protein GOBAR_DD22291 [Gossypium barbadense]|nr:hypothetical protein GOBAR_DD22291 [Gossypium barbadense]
MGIVKFNDPSGSNVAGNPLLRHLDPRVNAIIENGGNTTKTNVAESLMDNKELEFLEEVKGSEGVLRNLSVNSVSKKGVGEENLSGICPYTPGSVLNNGTVEEIPEFFRPNSE